MGENLISLFIDDEMNLEEKVTFVKTVHSNEAFSKETIALLEQEKLLYEMPVALPDLALKSLEKRPQISWVELFRSWWRPAAGFVTALLLVGIYSVLTPEVNVLSQMEEHRFVLYLPQADETKIVGTFTNWQPVPMEKIGSTGYWTLTLKLPPGEHRYSYLVEDGNQIIDPTVAVKEQDDFGKANSVIVVGREDDPVS
jgi:hypothetical protein